MKVNVVAMRKDKFYLTQRITCSRFLPNHRQTVAVPGDLHIVTADVTAAAVHGRNNLIFCDASWYIPVRTENHLLQFIRKNYSTVGRLSYHDVYSPNFFTFFKNTQAVFRYVRHEAIGWPRRKPTRYNQVWRRSASTPTTL